MCYIEWVNHMRDLVASVSKAREAAEATEAKCLIGPESECGDRIIRAHSIQRAKLKRIAEDDKVLSMSADLKKVGRWVATGEQPARWDHIFDYRSISNRMLTAQMACDVHDKQVFAPVEDTPINPQDPRHCELLAYRAVLFHLYKKNIIRNMFEDLFSDDPYFDIVMSNWREDATEAKRVKDHLDASLFATSTVRSPRALAHVALEIRVPPRIASTAVIMRGGRREAFTAREQQEIDQQGLPYSPQEFPVLLTVYPEKNKHVAVVSFPRGMERLARIVVPCIRQPTSRLAGALLSKTLLEETENILVSPRWWRSLSKAKKKRIFRQFMESLPKSTEVLVPNAMTSLPPQTANAIAADVEPAFLDAIEPETINLFA